MTQPDTYKKEPFEIVRKIEIDAAHRVPDHASKCFNIHGHRYVIEATVGGYLFTEGEQRGMVMDFGFLKDEMMTYIHTPCDHACIFYKDDPMLEGLFVDASNPDNGWKIYILDDVPTAENLARHWYYLLEGAIEYRFREWIDTEDPGLAPWLAKLRVYETPNCWADFTRYRRSGE